MAMTMTMTIRGIIFLTICLLVAACRLGPLQTITCDEIAEKRLNAVNFDDLDHERILVWIASNFDVNIADIIVSEYDPHDTPITEALEWRADDIRYRAEFADSELQRIQLHWAAKRPRGSDIIRCWGEPSYYEASFGAHAEISELALDLWYPEQGVVVSTLIPARFNRMPELSADTVMTTVTYVRPGPVETMLADIFAFVEPPPELETRWLARIKPWPGNWVEIQVDINASPQGSKASDLGRA